MQLESSVTLFDDNKVENRFAELQITADGITSEVSRKVGNDEVISRINQTAETIKIQADRVNIEGAAIFTDGRLSQNELDNAYDAKGAASSALGDAKSYADGAVSGKANKTDAIARQQRIYYRKTSAGAPSPNTTWLTSSGNGYGNWSLKIPPMTSGTTKYPYLYTAVQTQTVTQLSGTTCSCSAVLLDDTTTVIDGGTIITGTVNANTINASSGTFSEANIPNLSANKIKASVITAVNNSTETSGGSELKISANKVNIEGAAIFTDGRLSQNELDNAYDAKGAASDALEDAKDYVDDKGYQTASDVETAVSGKANKTDAVARQQRIYYRKTAAGAPGKNTTWLSTSGTGYGNWSLKIPPLTNGSTKYPYLYTAIQTQTVSQQAAGSSCSCSNVLLDDTTTVIDGGTIITGTLLSNAVKADSGAFDTALIPNLSADKITTGTIKVAVLPSEAKNSTYITDIGSDGIRVHDSHTSNNSIVINSSGMEVFKGGTGPAASVAAYGDTARVGKQSGSHVLTSANQFGMFNSTDEPYFSVTNTGTSRSNEYWQGAVIASGATGILGRFPLKNTSSTVQIRVEDDNGASTVLAGSALSNANVRTNNYSVTLTVDGNEVSGNVVVTCTNSSSSPYVTIKCKNNLGASAKIFMVYTRTMDIPALNFAGDNKLLWSGMKQMSDIDYIHLNESVSQQMSGIALVWAKSDYSAPNVQFVPKSLVRLRSTSSQGVAVNTIVVQSGFSNIGTKTVYVSDYDIEGHSSNAQTSGSGSSISPNHSGSWYLIYVFGV